MVYPLVFKAMPPLLAVGLALPYAPLSSAQEAPSTLEEDFNYPRADEIFEQTGVRLLRGDGHIELADCAAADGQLRVQSFSLDDLCFTVKRSPAFLSLEIPDVYLIYRGQLPLAAELRVDGEVQRLELESPRWNPVGVGASDDVVESTLLSLSSDR